MATQNDQKASQDDFNKLAEDQNKQLSDIQAKIKKQQENFNIKREFRKPADPRPNPLSKFASYTYQITLYMITPDAYDAFILSGRQNINVLRPTTIGNQNITSGAYIIAQSGGVSTENSQRAPGINFDYYIDNLKITSAIGAKLVQTSTAITDISFSITEPYGFSFISNLARAHQQINKNSKVKNIQNNVNKYKNFFIIGVRFQGYDENGNIIEPQTNFSQDTRSLPTNSSTGVYERFYDMAITELKYKLGTGPTVYNIKGRVIPTKIGLGTKFGIVPFSPTLSAITVNEAIQQLLGTLNENEQIAFEKKEIDIPNAYNVRFLANASTEIAQAKLKNPADLDKMKTAMANFNYSTEAGEAVAAKSSNVNYLKQNLSLEKGTPIVQAIQKIISQSEYLEKALKVIYTTANEPNAKTNSPSEIEKNDVPDIKWYNCGIEVKCLGFDTKRQDWSYSITYVIQTYETPATFSAFTKSTKYYGPVKRYRYWFTGQNSEILSYEQTLNNNYFMVALTGDQTGEGNGQGLPVPLATNQPQNSDPTGYKNSGKQAQNAFITNLYDPSSIAQAKIKILGDPDFLVMETPESINQVYNQFYSSNGFTINANGGEVFIEIDFNEAVDYDNNTGLLNINESIMIFPYPPEIASVVKGVSYQVGSVVSTFNRGEFEQELSLFLNLFPSATKQDNVRSSATTTPTPTTANSDVRRNPSNITNETLQRLGIKPFESGRGTGQRFGPKPNSNDDNQGLPGRSVPGGGNISDFPSA